MAVTGTYTAREIVTQALRKINVVPFGQAVEPTMFAEALDTLNLMLKAWQAQGILVYPIAAQSLALTANTREYTLDPVRPVSIHNARFKRNGTEIPMIEMTREEYDTLPVKTTTGTPTQFYYDRQREAARFYIWPVLSSVSGETIEITHIRELEDVEANSQVDVPGEMWEAVVYSLADRMADTLTINAPKVTARAEQAREEAMAFDREGSVFFGDAR